MEEYQLSSAREEEERSTLLEVEFGFVPRSNSPLNSIRYSAAESKLAEKLCHDIVNNIVEHSLDQVKGSGSWKHPISVCIPSVFAVCTLLRKLW